MATLISYDGSMDDTNNFGTGTSELQSFKLTSAASVTGISIKGSKGNASSGTTFTVNIRSDTYNGTILKTETFNTSILPSYTVSPSFFDITFTTPFSITDFSKTYFLEVIANNGDASDELRWSNDTTATSYADGTRWRGNGTQSASIDHNFKILGNAVIGLGVGMILGTVNTTNLGQGTTNNPIRGTSTQTGVIAGTKV